MEMRTYEGMFLLDPTQASQDWENTKQQVIAMLERRGGKVLNARKWGERKLAYEIKGHKRGTYLLVYFQMAPNNQPILQRDLQLSELVLRNLILVCDKSFKVTDIEKIAVEDEVPENAQEESPEEKETEESAVSEEQQKQVQSEDQQESTEQKEQEKQDEPTDEEVKG